MPDFHTIRLHGPWHAKVLSFLAGASVADTEQEKRVKIPSTWEDWLGATFSGVVAYERTFNLPTGLAPDQTVWLVIEEVDFLANISLNESFLGELRFAEGPLRLQVQQLLQPANKLRIEIATRPLEEQKSQSETAGGLTGSVRLEIEEPTA